MKIGIDLLWVRPGKCGGTESVIRNLLTGFGMFGQEDRYLLFTARDNANTFREYEQKPNMEIQICDVLCANQMKRILWENLHLDRLAAKCGVDCMFIPVYSKPFSMGSRIPYVTLIHDLQALHYPEYFSWGRRLFFRYMWWYACRTSRQIITISNYCKKDLVGHYPWAADRLRVIYDPVDVKEGESGGFSGFAEKYDIKPEEYFYCVSSLLPHKNLITILRVMAELKRRGMSQKLVLSGVGGDHKAFAAELQKLGIEDSVIQTGFVSDEERDCLYENCKVFLFPSIFEGFGMPPVEAMRKGRPVVMTRKSCLEEVTEGKAIYVEQPMDVGEWLQKIEFAGRISVKPEAFPQYALETITGQFMEVFRDVIGI